MNFYLISNLRQLCMKKTALVFFLCLDSAIVSLVRSSELSSGKSSSFHMQ